MAKTMLPPGWQFKYSAHSCLNLNGKMVSKYRKPIYQYSLWHLVFIKALALKFAGVCVCACVLGTQAWQTLFIRSHDRVHFIAHFILHSHRMQHLLSRSYFYHWWTFFCFYFILYFSSSSSFRWCIVFLFCPLFFHPYDIFILSNQEDDDWSSSSSSFFCLFVVECAFLCSICHHRIDSPSSQIKQRFIANACRNNTICFGLNLMAPYVYVCAPFFCVSFLWLLLLKMHHVSYVIAKRIAELILMEC